MNTKIKSILMLAVMLTTSFSAMAQASDAVADSTEFEQRHGLMQEMEEWSIERLRTLTFREFRNLYLASVDAKKAELNRVGSVTFRREKHKEIDSFVNLNLSRWLWANPGREDADAEAWILSFDHNDPANLNSASNYLRWHLESHKETPGNSYIRQIGQIFTNQDVINHFADDLVINWLQNAPANMDELLADYKQVSTNTEGHRKAEEVYARYKKYKKGMPAMNFSFSDKKGKVHHLSDFRGKALYVDIWATWCGPCVAEIPYMEKLAAKLKGDKRLNIISISFDSNKDKWLSKLAADKPDWPQYICPENFNSDFCKEYDIQSIPRFMFFDKDGNIISLNAPRPSMTDMEKWFDEQLK